MSQVASTQTAAPATSTTQGAFRIVPFAHPQGCRGFLIAELLSGQALAVDVHQDLVADVTRAVETNGWKLVFVVDTHTHADHPSGSAALAARFGSAERVAHAKSGHAGVRRHPGDGEKLPLGREHVTVWHTPGHTPDHMVLVAGDALFSGDTLLIGGVARTDFLGGDAGALFDSVRRLLTLLPDATVLYPSHDYQGRVRSTLGDERATNPWLAIADRDEFVKALTANPPPRPANMDDLLRHNREGAELPTEIPATLAARKVAQGGARSLIDVRTPAEVAAEHVPGSVHVPLADLATRLDEILSVPAPRMLLCRSGVRATTAQKTLTALGVSGLAVVTGGIEAYRVVGDTAKTSAGMSLERQVRIAAGALVFLSVLGGLALHPLFLLVAGFVGAGLVFSGVTDWCGMGLLLARMPWNTRAAPAQAATPAAPGGTCAAQAPAAGTCAAQAPAAATATASASTPAAGGTCAASPPAKG